MMDQIECPKILEEASDRCMKLQSELIKKVQSEEDAIAIAMAFITVAIDLFYKIGGQPLVKAELDGLAEDFSSLIGKNIQ
jgi:hypothetical protein